MDIFGVPFPFGMVHQINQKMQTPDSCKHKRMLYVSVKPTPYRTLFFNSLAKKCDLTVLYESAAPGARDAKWQQSEELRHKAVFLKESSGGSSLVAFLRMMRMLLGKWDAVVIGCWNLRMELLATLLMRLLGVPYTLNLDGEYFFSGTALKQRMKRFFVRGARSYVVAGEESAKSLKEVVGNRPVIVYYFSSLTDDEIRLKAQSTEQRGDTLLVVGRNFPYKGMDVIPSVARMNPSLRFKLVGMGETGTEAFKKENNLEGIENIEFVPFLQKDDLDKEYRSSRMLILPSRRECWGLVVNEAAAFGTPIVSTLGSGAAVEFLGTDYPQLLAKPGDAESLNQCIQTLLAMDDVSAYSRFLKQKSEKYTISTNVMAHLALFE